MFLGYNSLLKFGLVYFQSLDHFPVSILVAMEDTLLIHKLMNFVMSVTSRKIIHSGQVLDQFFVLGFKSDSPDFFLII